MEKRKMPASEAQDSKNRIAVFDFDGTILDGHSPVMLVHYLYSRRVMRQSTLAAVGWWGVRYKLRLPHEQSEVRERIFNLFKDQTVEEVDQMMVNLYDQEISLHLRKDALDAIHAYQADGVEVIIVSASFEAIVKRAASQLGVKVQLSTRMEEKDGHYTGNVGSAPMEGAEKSRGIVDYANTHYGKGNWELVAAFGDHHSDVNMLELAQRPVAVTPDNKLERIAKDRGWEIANWR